MTDAELTARYENLRMDWRAMFVWDPSKRLLRLIGSEADRDGHAAEMWRRKDNYRRWMNRRGGFMNRSTK